MNIFRHESAYRSPELMEKIKTHRIVICGAGALGANIAESLTRQGFGSLTVIDKDRVEDHNRATQPYGKADVGAQKAKALYARLYRDTGTQITAIAKELTPENAKKLLQGDLVIDAFDNTESRQAVKDACLNLNIPCLHVGLASNYGEVIWNEVYKVPKATDTDLCDYPLARNIVMLTISVACEIVFQSIESGININRAVSITLKDLKTNHWDIE